ncbi:hypothetical protein M8J75_014945 [Diaphorina citri]|nr:hypothetical protein M8J75_014945 [Diaphorina citri]
MDHGVIRCLKNVPLFESKKHLAPLRYAIFNNELIERHDRALISPDIGNIALTWKTLFGRNKEGAPRPSSHSGIHSVFEKSSGDESSS